MSVPFLGKDVPSERAEFASPEVVIGLTILAYRYEGMRYDDLLHVIRQLKSDLEKQIGPFRDRPARILFDSWVAVARKQAERTGTLSPEYNYVYPLELLQPDDPEQMKVLMIVLAKTPQVVLYYLQTYEFPTVMQFQSTKLTAAGIDLGGDMLFDIRLGFSGTPSDLIPPALGNCQFEPGSEAQILRVLSSPQYVESTNFPLEGHEDWNVESLLVWIATHEQPRFSALIDTGALITGYTNEQVARYLLKHGLPQMEACVFLDSQDRKVIVDRTPNPPLLMNRSGVAMDKRFTFYDQVHTTVSQLTSAPHVP